LQRLLALQPFETARKIVILGPEARERLDELRGRGFDAYLIKPLRRASLIAQITAEAGGAAADTPDERGAPKAEGAGVAEGGFRILLAEDNQINALLATSLLTKHGHRVDQVGNGIEALEALARAPYDLVLMDVHMPELDGLEATRRLRAGHDPAADVPVIALTANAMDDDRARCLAAGMDDFVTKPVSPAELYRTVDRWAGGRHESGAADRGHGR
jgi:CheY-like chemotaxis protein